jgi:hypothetical protein
LEPIISFWAFRLVDNQLTVAGQRRIFTDFPQKETKATTKLRLQSRIYQQFIGPIATRLGPGDDKDFYFEGGAL